ncbi:MAG TPA: gamma-glutamyltransferase [Candidatus Ozemobacteraceae bacterium]|nr:gamma-glutamyltransferase [Candidatus Ozemobacteraceae bacterium]
MGNAPHKHPHITGRALLVALALILAPAASFSGPERVLVASGSFGAVATANPLATRAALKILERGGNAVDAAVAAGFVLGVVDPSASGLGGDGFALIRLPDGTIDSWDGSACPTAPTRRLSAGTAGRRRAELASSAIGLPTLPGLLLTIRENYGTERLPPLLAPAIHLAREGFPCSANLEKVIAHNLQRLRDSSAVELFYRGERPIRAGEILKQKALGDTLCELAREGKAWFYVGAGSRKILEDMRLRGSRYFAEDLAGYQPRKSPPLSLVIGPWRLAGTPLPSSSVAVMALTESWTRAGLDPLEHSRLDDALPVLQSILRLTRQRLSSCASRPDLFLALNRIGANRLASPIPAPLVQEEPQSATHLVVWDRNGMIVSMTMSLRTPFGTGEYSPLGFFYNSDSPADAAPISPHSPILVLRDDLPVLALGGSGGNGIVSILAAILASFFHHQNLPRAVNAPRFSATEQGSVVLEWSPRLGGLERIRENRKSVTVEIPGSDWFGLVSGIASQGRSLLAVGDYHRDGSAGAVGRDPDAPRTFVIAAMVYRERGLDSVALAQPVVCPRQTTTDWSGPGETRLFGANRRLAVDFPLPGGALLATAVVTIHPDLPAHASGAWDAPERWSKPPRLASREQEFLKRIPTGLSPRARVDWLMVEIGLRIPYAAEKSKMNGEDLLRKGRGDCSGKARLFEDMVRSFGIPCRLVGGVILKEGINEKTHIWNEVFLDGKWVSVCTVNHLCGRLPATWLILRYGDAGTLEDPGKVLFRTRERRPGKSRKASEGIPHVTPRDRPGGRSG